MILALNLFLFHILFAEESIFLKKGDKHFLPNASAYHFSKKNLIEFFPKESPPFFIGKSTGELFIRWGHKQKKRKVFILSTDQMSFYERTKNYLLASPHLRLLFKDKQLVITGQIFDFSELQFFIKNCQNKENIRLDFKYKNPLATAQKLFKEHGLKTLPFETQLESADPHHPLHSCFSKSLKSTSEYLAHFLLTENRQQSFSNHGLGADSHLNWTPKKIQPYQGSARSLKGRGKVRQLLNFESWVSPDAPVHFSDGQEFQVVDQRGPLSVRSSWKKVATSFDLHLLETSDAFAKVKIDLKQTLGSRQSSTFKTNQYSKTASLLIGEWKKLLSYSNQNNSSDKNFLFKSLFLGTQQRSQQNTSYSLWIKLRKYGKSI